MALLGQYYAHKISGAAALALFRRTGDAAQQATAVDELTQGAAIWKRYSASNLERFKNPLWTNRVGYVDWHELDGEVDHDIEIARKATAEAPQKVNHE